MRLDASFCIQQFLSRVYVKERMVWSDLKRFHHPGFVWVQKMGNSVDVGMGVWIGGGKSLLDRQAKRKKREKSRISYR